MTTVASGILSASALTSGDLRRRPGEEETPRATSGIIDHLEVGRNARWLPVHWRGAATSYTFSLACGDLTTLARLIDSLFAGCLNGGQPRREELLLP